MESENIFVLSEDEEPVEESTTAVGVVIQDESQEFQNPWLHLESNFFLMLRHKRNTKILYFQCVIYQPKETTTKRKAVGLYNLRSHIKRKYPAYAIQFEERMKASSSRGKQIIFWHVYQLPVVTTMCKESTPVYGRQKDCRPFCQQHFLSA